MELIGQKVIHSKFGEGIVTRIRMPYITIAFVSLAEPKEFRYPECFTTYLKMLDPATEAKIDRKISRREDAFRDEKKRDQLEDNQAAVLTQQQSVMQRQKSEKPIKTVAVSPFSSTNEFYDAYVHAIDREISYLRENGGRPYRVTDGIRVEGKDNHYVYVFETDTELNLPEDIQIEALHRHTKQAGRIIGCQEFVLIVDFPTDQGLKINVMEFTINAWQLLLALRDRLIELQSGMATRERADLLRSLICEGLHNIERNNGSIVSGTENALQMSLTKPILFIWGPPGTGKTETLAHIAIKHMQQGNRVLMLSYSNVSVDGAIWRTYQKCSDQKPGKLIRYGYPRDKRVLNHEYLSSYNYAILSHSSLMQERKHLLQKAKEVPKQSEQYVKITKRLHEIRASLVQAEKDSVSDALFVATTVSKAVIDSTVYGASFDTVIFDEASMAYIPQIVFSASLAKAHFICIGDFRQLPPIVQGDSSSILNADIFQYCGITSAVDSHCSHKWLCLLDTQYRMHPDIAAFASRTMYGGLLKSSPDLTVSLQSIVDAAPYSSHEIGFADLTGMLSACVKTNDGSHVNILSALFSFSLALDAAINSEVGIITPYHAQSRLIHAMSKDAAASSSVLKPITCATVHQFQGSEKEVIIYDVVDCSRMPYPGVLVTSTNNNIANRLFNVALTRAKGKFIGVANIEYFDRKRFPAFLMFKQLMDTQRRQPSLLKGKELIKAVRRTSEGRCLSIHDESKAYVSYMQDIAQAKKEIRIDLPDTPVDPPVLSRLGAALQKAKNRGVLVYIRANSKTGISRDLLQYVTENHYLINPITLIDRHILWFHVPQTSARFVMEGTYIPTLYQPPIRFVGSHTGRVVFDVLRMSNTNDDGDEVIQNSDGEIITDTFSSYVYATVKCRSCGKPMRLRKGKTGKYSLSCSGYPDCMEGSYVPAELINQYFYHENPDGKLCPKCHCSLEAKTSSYGLYIQCCGLEHHKFRLDQL